MLDFVKQLFESNAISEEMKSEIEQAWQQRIQENRDHVTATLREEFAQKYEHDKSVMAEAVDNMVQDRLMVELSELAEDRRGLIEAKAKYAKNMKKHCKEMDEFVIKRLANEIYELHEDRKTVASNFERLEGFVIENLSKEIAEFYTDKKDLAESKVKLVRESKEKFEQLKMNFIKKSAKVVENVVTSKLKSEIAQLKEDIESARRNDFGRRIFEAVASEYATSYLNESSETARLLKVLEKKDQKLEEANNKIAEVKMIAESKDKEIRITKDMMVRKEIMGELLSPLRADKKEVMGQLLESITTEKLRGAYDKYLPAVMAGDAPKKKALVEAKEVTGNKEAPINSGKTAEILTIRKLAGLK